MHFVMCQQAELACDPLYSLGCRFESCCHLPRRQKFPRRSNRLGGSGNKPENRRSPATNLPRDSVTPVNAGPGEDLQREHSMYTASKRYLAASVSALTLAIMLMLLAIAAWSIAPDVAADTSEITAQLKKSLPP
jgi:hypothetical protein